MARKRKTVEKEEEVDDELEEAIKLWREEPKEELDVATSQKQSYNIIRLVNTISARVRLHGTVTGEFYEWEKSGAVVSVDERDAPDLLAKTYGSGSCCGSNTTNHIFEIIEE